MRKATGPGEAKGAGFRNAEVLFDCGMNGVNFFGAGPSLSDSPPEFDKQADSASGAAKGKGKPAVGRPLGKDAHPEFETSGQGGFAAFVPSAERCAW